VANRHLGTKTFERGAVLFGASALVLAGSSAPAHAYLDGGTASLLIQALVGGLAAAGVVLVGVRQKIMSFFGKSSKETPEETAPSSNKVEPGE